jgi:hypothetical protein
MNVADGDVQQEILFPMALHALARELVAHQQVDHLLADGIGIVGTGFDSFHRGGEELAARATGFIDPDDHLPIEGFSLRQMAHETGFGELTAPLFATGGARILSGGADLAHNFGVRLENLLHSDSLRGKVTS